MSRKSFGEVNPFDFFQQKYQRNKRQKRDKIEKNRVCPV